MALDRSDITHASIQAVLQALRATSPEYRTFVRPSIPQIGSSGKPARHATQGFRKVGAIKTSDFFNAAFLALFLALIGRFMLSTAPGKKSEVCVKAQCNSPATPRNLEGFKVAERLIEHDSQTITSHVFKLKVTAERTREVQLGHLAAEKELPNQPKWGNMSAYALKFPTQIQPRTLTVSLNLEQLINDPLVAEDLVEQYYAFVYRLALSILDDPDEAEDATQETFIAAVSNLGRYRGESSPKTWLYSIALNTCRGQLRKRKARFAMRKTWHALQSLMSGPPTPEESTERNETDTILWRAVDDLGEKQRLPVILRYAHNLSVPEIAQLLGISEGTVHSRLHYARRTLHGYLSHADILDRQERAKR